VLKESVPEGLPDRKRLLADVDRIMEILHQRKECYRRRRPSIVNLISAMQIERFLTNGLVGRIRLPEDIQAQRCEMARNEVKHLISLIEQESMGTQIGLVTDNLPGTGFMIFRQGDTSTLSISPFRLGENPNFRVGVAMVTSAPEAVTLHQNVVEEAWRTAIKGQAAAAYMNRLLDDQVAKSGAPSRRLKLSR
jgi:hypothetical protein